MYLMPLLFLLNILCSTGRRTLEYHLLPRLDKSKNNKMFGSVLSAFGQSASVNELMNQPGFVEVRGAELCVCPFTE